MDQILSLLMVVHVAAGELREWQHVPPREVCERNLQLSRDYQAWLYRASFDCPFGGWFLWAQYLEAQEAGRVWDWLLECAKEDDRDRKLRALEMVRVHMGNDAAFFRGEWPGPLPRHHFQPVRELPPSPPAK